MKKILKKEVIIAFIIGIVLASSITVYATGYIASQVTYKDGKTVEYALNDLYTKISSLGTFYSKNSNVGTASTNRNTNISIEKGKYILAITEYNARYYSNAQSTSISISTQNDIRITKISENITGVNGNGTITSGVTELLEMYKIEANENGVLNVISSDAKDSNSHGAGLSYIIVKI